MPWTKISSQALSLNKVFDETTSASGILPTHGPHCASCKIGSKQGVLLYIKASQSGDEADYILDYKRRNRDFPHETTSDQFFAEEQLEVYRALWFHIMKGLITGETSIAVEAETEEAAKKKLEEFLQRIHAALLGTNAKVPLRC